MNINAKKEHGGYTMDMLIKRARQFAIGDKVEVEASPGELEIATIERFYPHLVMYSRKDGTKFTLQYFEAAQARLVKRANFQVRSEEMDQEAVVKAMGTRRVGDDDG